jgi:hypothetical protein
VSWSGVDLIPRRPGESKAEEVARVYAGGTAISFDDYDVIIEPIPGAERDVTRITGDGRRRMLHAIQLLQTMDPTFHIVHEAIEPGRRWPWYLDVVADDAPLWATVYQDCTTIRPDGQPSSDDDWRFWWRTIRLFARDGCAVYVGDDSELVAASLPAERARQRYFWF